MAEVQFAKTFMALMDRKQVRLSSDFVSDPRKYPSQSAYTLPKPTHPFPRQQKPAPGATKDTTVSVTLKPTKGGADPVNLPSQDVAITVLELKTQYAQKTSQDISKIRLLYNKRPASDLKTLKELLPDPNPPNVEFSVMVMGGGVSSPAVSTPQASSPAVEIPDPTAVPVKTEGDGAAPLSEQAEALAATVSDTARHAADVLKSEQFWDDLKDFLVQRLRDENVGEQMVNVFRSASRSRDT